jgi:hypothetical protein
MPERLWIYLMALLYFPRVSTCVPIAAAFAHATHDCLTRRLNGRWSGQILLAVALRTLFTVTGGWLIIDDTVVVEPYARQLGEAAGVWSNKDKKVRFGVSVVLWVWTDGQVRIPVAFRVWKKEGPSKYVLALELLSYARNRLKCKPQFVLFDSWYPAKPLLKRIRDYDWYLVCQLKKNRSFAGRALPTSLHQPYWQAVGELTGGLKVCVVQYRRKYYATHRRSVTAKEVRQHSKIRHAVEIDQSCNLRRIDVLSLGCLCPHQGGGRPQRPQSGQFGRVRMHEPQRMVCPCGLARFEMPFIDSGIQGLMGYLEVVGQLQDRPFMGTAGHRARWFGGKASKGLAEPICCVLCPQ